MKKEVDEPLRKEQEQKRLLGEVRAKESDELGTRLDKPYQLLGEGKMTPPASGWIALGPKGYVKLWEPGSHCPAYYRTGIDSEDLEAILQQADPGRHFILVDDTDKVRRYRLVEYLHIGGSPKI